MFVNDGPGFNVKLGHLGHQDLVGTFFDRHERAVCRATFFTKGRQHDLLDRIIPFKKTQKRCIKHARTIAFGRRFEFVIKAETVEEIAKTRVVVMRKAFMGAKRVRHAGQCLAKMLRDHILVRDIVGYLAKTVHVIREAEKFGRNIGHLFERAADIGRARNFAKRPDMGQARRAITGFKQHITLFRLLLFVPLNQLAGFLEGPDVAVKGGITKIGCHF